VNKYYVRREALVWTTRLRTERGVGVTGNGVGLLNSQTTKRDSLVSEEGEVLFTANTVGVKDHIARWTWVMSQKFLGSQ
jgi:hypothetical protein